MRALHAILAVVLVLSILLLAGVVGTQPAWRLRTGTRVEVLDFLPRNCDFSGQTDYTSCVQRAIDEASGRTLVLPPFPVLVKPVQGTKHCLIAKASMTIVGTAGSELRTNAARVQLLRFESADGVHLSGFLLRGAGGIGAKLAHGLLQVWNCEDVALRELVVLDADADGIAIAESENVRVESCVVERASKAGIYLSDCDAAVVANNVVRDTVGHVAPNGLLVGTGILLLSNSDLVCSSNAVVGGIGPGILCGANDLQPAPDGNSIVGNRIRDCTNLANPATSGGIQLANVQAEHRTQTLVASNSIRGCGQHGILVENHDGAVVEGNTIEDAWMSPIVVGHARGVVVTDNTLVDGNVAGANGQAGVYLHAHTSGCVVRGNVVVGLERAPLLPAIDRALPGLNSVQ